MPNITLGSSINATLNIANDVNPISSVFLSPEFDITAGPTSYGTLTLVAGANTIAVPTGTLNGMIVIMPTVAGTGTPAIPFNLKGVTGDTGFPAGLGSFQVMLFNGATIPASFVITNNYTSTVTGYIYFF